MSLSVQDRATRSPWLGRNGGLAQAANDPTHAGSFVADIGQGVLAHVLGPASPVPGQLEALLVGRRDPAVVQGDHLPLVVEDRRARRALPGVALVTNPEIVLRHESV